MHRARVQLAMEDILDEGLPTNVRYGHNAHQFVDWDDGVAKPARKCLKTDLSGPKNREGIGKWVSDKD